MWWEQKCHAHTQQWQWLDTSHPPRSWAVEGPGSPPPTAAPPLLSLLSPLGSAGQTSEPAAALTPTRGFPEPGPPHGPAGCRQRHQQCISQETTRGLRVGGVGVEQAGRGGENPDHFTCGLQHPPPVTATPKLPCKGNPGPGEACFTDTHQARIQVAAWDQVGRKVGAGESKVTSQSPGPGTLSRAEVGVTSRAEVGVTSGAEFRVTSWAASLAAGVTLSP